MVRCFMRILIVLADLTTRVTLKAQGIKSIAVAPYFDKSGNLIAMIGVDYVGRKADKELILERQRGSDVEWSSNDQKHRFMNAVNSIGNAMLTMVDLSVIKGKNA